MNVNLSQLLVGMFDGKDSTTNPLTVIMQFILHATNFPTASINKITTFEKSVVFLNFLIYEKGKIPFSCSNSCSW